MGSNDLKISIITINYNNAVGLKETIQSVVNQTYSNIEYIVIDGGSEDGSKEILAAYKDQIHYSVAEPDDGIYHAMNKGIRIAKGTYLLFLNSGDVLINKKVIQMAVAEGLSHDLVYGNLVFVNGEKRRDWIPASILSFQTFYTTGIPHPTTFIHKKLFEVVGLYNESYRIVSDWEFFLLATCRYNANYKHINLFITAFSEDGISSNPSNLSRIAQERETVLKTHFPLFVADYQNYNEVKRELKKVMFIVKLRKMLKFFSKKKSI